MNEEARTTTETPAPRKGPALFVGIGALSMLVGSFLEFGTAALTLPSSEGSLSFPGGTVTGTDTSDGKFFVVVAIVLAVSALIIAARTSPGLRTGAVMVAIFGSLLVLYMSLADLLTFRSDLQEDLYGRASGPLADIPFDEFKDFVRVDTGPGLYLVIVGAALGAIGGVMALLTYRRKSDSVRLTDFD